MVYPLLETLTHTSHTTLFWPGGGQTRALAQQGLAGMCPCRPGALRLPPRRPAGGGRKPA
eukprot:1892520-Alexandrium_andersonii.AAC.1